MTYFFAMPAGLTAEDLANLLPDATNDLHDILDKEEHIRQSKLAKDLDHNRVTSAVVWVDFLNAYHIDSQAIRKVKGRERSTPRFWKTYADLTRFKEQLHEYNQLDVEVRITENPFNSAARAVGFRNFGRTSERAAFEVKALAIEYVHGVIKIKNPIYYKLRLSDIKQLADAIIKDTKSGNGTIEDAAELMKAEHLRRDKALSRIISNINNVKDIDNEADTTLRKCQSLLTDLSNGVDAMDPMHTDFLNVSMLTKLVLEKVVEAKRTRLDISGKSGAIEKLCNDSPSISLEERREESETLSHEASDLWQSLKNLSGIIVEDIAIAIDMVPRVEEPIEEENSTTDDQPDTTSDDSVDIPDEEESENDIEVVSDIEHELEPAFSTPKLVTTIISIECYAHHKEQLTIALDLIVKTFTGAKIIL